MCERKRLLVRCALCLTLLLGMGCTGVAANAPAFSGAGSGGVAVLTEQPASLARNKGTAPGQNAKAEVESPVSGRACLKEGVACNTLNDRCCSGYWCFGGLVPTCVRKP